MMKVWLQVIITLFMNGSSIANNKLILGKIKGEPLTRTDLSSTTDQAKNIYPKGYEIIDKYIKQSEKRLSID